MCLCLCVYIEESEHRHAKQGELHVQRLGGPSGMVDSGNSVYCGWDPQGV